MRDIANDNTSNLNSARNLRLSPSPRDTDRYPTKY